MERVLQTHIRVGAESLPQKILMPALRLKLLIVEPNEEARTKLCIWLSQEGYSVFECQDAYKALRLVRQVRPDLVLLNCLMTGINANHLIGIIESEKLSMVLLMTSQENDEFNQLLEATRLKTWIKKPINRKLFIAKLEEAFSLLRNIKKLESQQYRKVQHDGDAGIIDEAKNLLMTKWNLSEDEAYGFIRKSSMDYCVSKVNFARRVIAKNGGMR